MGYRSVQGGKYWSFLSTKSWRLNMISRLLESITDSMDMYLRWANSRRQWRREASGVLQSMGLRRVRQWLHNCACVLTCFSCVQLFATLWLIALHAPLSMGFSMQQYWNALPCPPPGNFPNPGIEPVSLAVPALQADSSPLRPLWRPLSSLKAYCLWSDTNAYIQVSLRVTVIKYNFVIYLLNFW